MLAFCKDVFKITLVDKTKPKASVKCFETFSKLLKRFVYRILKKHNDQSGKRVLIDFIIEHVRFELNIR